VRRAAAESVDELGRPPGERANMKSSTGSMVAVLTLITAAIASSPIAFHPAAPHVPATKAIEIADKYVGAATHSARYCCSAVLDEGGMAPAPHGSSRHWHLQYQDAGAERTNVLHVYVAMDGQAGSQVPPLSR